MPALAVEPTQTTPATAEPLAERLHRIERSIAEQQEDYAATRRRIESLLDAGDRGVLEALDHAADLALNLGALYRHELDLLGRLAERAESAADAPPALRRRAGGPRRRRP